MGLKRLKIPLILFLVSLFLNVYGIWWGLPNYYNWSTDDLTPTHPLFIAKNQFKINSEYPIFHYVLLDIVYSPYLGYLYLTGGLVNPHQGFPYGFTDPLTSLTFLSLLSRLVSAIMGALAVVFVYLGVKTLYGKKAALFSALAVAFSHIFILFSHLGNLDIPYIFWFSIALYAYANLIKTYKTKHYILLGIFTALAVSTKDQIGGFFILLPIPLLYLHLKHHLREHGLKRAIFHKKLIYCLVALLFTFILFNNILVDFSGFQYRTNLYLSGEAIEGSATFPNNFLGQLQLFQEAFFKLEYSVGIFLSLLFIVSLIYCIYKFDDYTFAFLIPLISYYIFDTIMINYIRYRFTIPIIIILSFFAGRFLSDMVKEINTKKFIYPVIVLIFAHAFLYGFSADLTLVYDSRHSAEEWMLKNVEKDAKIEIYHEIQYLPRFHAFGYTDVSAVFFHGNKSIKPPIILFKPVIAPPSLESLKARSPDYIVLPGRCDTVLEYLMLPEGLNKKKASLMIQERGQEKIKKYMDLLLSEKAGYKIVRVFDNKIPFAPETPFFKKKRTNVPVIILKKEV